MAKAIYTKMQRLVGRRVDVDPDVETVEPYFDADWYLLQNTDVAKAGLNPVEHFLEHGWREGRAPNIWFDEDTYVANVTDAQSGDVNSFLHLINTAKENDQTPFQLYLAPRIRETLKSYSDPHLTAVLRQLEQDFDAAYYLEKYADVAGGAGSALVHYLDRGWQEGRVPNAWFDAATYKRRQPELSKDDGNPFLHLLANALAQGKRPEEVYGDTSGGAFKGYIQDTPISSGPVTVQVAKPGAKEMREAAKGFDAEYYLQQNPDIAQTGVDPLLHFMTLGWIEGRDPSPDFSVRYYLRHSGDIRRAGINPLLHYLRSGHKENWRKSASVEQARVLERFEKGGDMVHLVDAAMALDPMVGFPREAQKYSAPLHHLGHVTKRVKQLRQSFAQSQYDVVIAVPHVRMSGAARVAAIFTRVLAGGIDPSRILVVITDSSETPYLHWFPDGVRIFDLHEVTQGLGDLHAAQAFIDLLRGIDAKTFVNINSRRVWDCMSIYGRQLSQEFQVVTYLFTWDETKEGLRGGYPIQWLRDTADYQHVVLTDTVNLAQDIVDRFGFDQSQVLPLYTPVEERTVPVVRPSKTDTARLLWAGRFDRQKRVDILMAIARANPDVTIDVYGKAVLDADGLDAYNPPANINYKGTYDDLKEVLETPYHGFLYTAQWDGLPTVLLDMGQAGLPIIAPRVGGIDEVINAETGWLVDDFQDVLGYSKAISRVVSDQDEALRRADALQALMADKITETKYAEQLKNVVKLNDV